MKIISERGPFIEISEREYNPTAAELHYYYGGTHTGLDPSNPYATKHGMSVTKVRLVPVSLAKTGVVGGEK